MKRIYVIIGIILVAIGLMVFSLSQWNNKINTTTENAKEKIEVTKKIDPSLTGDAPAGKDDTQGNDSNPNPANSSKSTNSTNGSVGADDSPNDPTSSDGAPSSAGSNGVSAQADSGQPDSGQTLKELKADYQAVFTDLEAQESSIIDQLVVQAKADYVSNKYTKEDLAIKYQEAATELENNADQTFNTIYKQLEFDLEKYGYDKNEAIPFKTAYDAKKQERLAHVITELLNF